MRKNTVDTFKAWQARRPYKGGGAAVWTDGVHVYSYNTRIIEVRGQQVLFNQEKYSVTTSNHQNGLRLLMSHNGIGCEPMNNG